MYNIMRAGAAAWTVRSKNNNIVIVGAAARNVLVHNKNDNSSNIAIAAPTS